MEKNFKILAYLFYFIFVSIDLSSKDALSSSIIVDVSEQRLYLMNDNNLIQSFPVSTSKFGEGQTENSYKTPLGYHEIKEKIGHNAPINTIFTARVNTQKKAKIQKDPDNTDDDFVTSRILWLDGLEEGINRGPGVDSYNRYIYIHGTHEEGLIGQKASHGCIRMFNNDVIELFEIVKEGTKVYIRA